MTTPIYGIPELTLGQIDQFATANEAIRQLELYDTLVRINAQTGTSYTLVLADRGKLVTMTNSSENTVTVPPNSSVAYPVGTVIYLSQLDAGQTTVAAGAGVTINTTETLLSRGQYAMMALINVGTNAWLLTGEREAA